MGGMDVEQLKDCKLSHTRPVWRLENGQAVLVAYEIYRGPGNQYGTIPAVLGRTRKTVRGARRRTVIVSVLESLRQHLPTCTLSSLSWMIFFRSRAVRIPRALRAHRSTPLPFH